MRRRFQNRIASSRWSLPFMLFYAAVSWALRLISNPDMWPSLLLFGLGTYFMIELNNRNALMRQYSRMMSCSYIAMMTMCGWLFDDARTVFLQLCVILAFTLIFRSYQRRDDMDHCFWAYLFIGLAAFVWPPVLLLVPLFWIGEMSYLMSFCARAFFASLLGIVAPVWIALPFVFYTGRCDLLLGIVDGLVPDETFVQALASPETLLSYPDDVSPLRIASGAVVVIMLLVGMVHYVRQSFTDKIHVRMLYHFFMLVAAAFVVALLCIMLLPFAKVPAASSVLSVLIVCASPLVAHYMTFTSTRLTNISVIFFMSVIFILTVAQFLSQIAF